MARSRLPGGRSSRAWVLWIVPHAVEAFVALGLVRPILGRQLPQMSMQGAAESKVDYDPDSTVSSRGWHPSWC